MESNVTEIGNFYDSKQFSSIINVLNQQRNTARLCDVTLQISDIQINAHSCVLASASPYFDELFNEQDNPRPFCPKNPQIIEIHIDGQADPAYQIAVDKVVSFMYTSRLVLEHAILTQVMEIAKIMRMSNILELCGLYEQGCRFIGAEERMMKPPMCDGTTQTDDDTTSCEQDLIVVNGQSAGSKGADQRWLFQKKMPMKPAVTVSLNQGFKRKRGRPRKVKLPEIETKVVNQNLCHEKENVDAEKEQLPDDENSTRSALNDSESQDVINKANTDAHIRVSRHGRVIKPRKFSDDTISYVKKEVLNDIEQEIENMAEPDVDTGDVQEHFKFLDDEQTDPTYGETSVQVEVVELQTYQCDRCSFSTHKISQYNNHNKEHLHADKKCSFCGWVGENPDITNEEFEAHLKGHTGDDPYFCSFCPARFSSKAKLFQHLPKHSEVKPYTCDICDAGFKWKHALKSHLITHKDSKDFLCDICGFATAHKSQLKAHHLIHTGETFKCTEPGCDFQATKRSNLKFHMMTHTREKPHQCEVCGTSFSLVKNLRRHSLLHKSDRPYRCNRCTFCTTRYDKLKEHFLKQHNIGTKPAKKMRLTDYIKAQENMTLLDDNILDQDNVMIEGQVLQIGEGLETIELQVEESVSGIQSTTQIVNVTSSTGETIPITITQKGKEISYEIPALAAAEEGKEVAYEIPQFPFQIVSQEVVTE